MRIRSFLPLLLLFSCTRDGRNLTADSFRGTWFQTAEAADGQDLWCPYYYDSCALDDAWYFAGDGTYAVIDTGLRCAVPPPRGSWRLQARLLRVDSTDYEVLRCDRELWLEGKRIRNGFMQRHELRFRRA